MNQDSQARQLQALQHQNETLKQQVELLKEVICDDKPQHALCK